MDGAPREGMATIVILPVIRIERDPDETSDGGGPEEGAAPAAAAAGSAEHGAVLSVSAIAGSRFWNVMQRSGTGALKTRQTES